MDIDFEALHRSFLAESEEGLASMEEALMVLEQRPRDAEALGQVFRIAHTIKGTSAMFDFTGVERLAHVLEELLDRLRKRSLAATGELVSLLLRAVDVLRTMIPEAVAGDSPMRPAERSMLDELSRAAAAEVPGAVAAELPAAAPGERRADPFSERRSDGPAEITDTAAAEPSFEAAARSAGTLRVDLRKLDRLLDLTGEIAVARGRLAQLLEDPTLAPILETLRQADFLHLELQELVMKLRMVPVGPVFRRYRRTVRDLAKAQGKVARLVIEGEEVEVDATVIEHLRDPLTHMVRNALDHGIESPAARSAAGKAPCGLVTLKAWHEAGTIVIELSDDGAGLDRERILERARAAGLVEGGDLTEQEVDELIFEPGFSTTDTVTDLSGRGVGMDVVRRNIDALRGSVNLASIPGLGTAVTIRLPLTLAIIEGFQVGVDGETYIIPMDAVVETLAFEPRAPLCAPADHRPDGGGRGDGRGVINLRGTSLPYVRLRELLRLGGTPPARESILVVHHENGLAGLLVDDLLGESQTVIKPMSKLFRRLPGISGSTILDNGKAAFILYVPDLLRREIARLPPSEARTSDYG